MCQVHGCDRPVYSSGFCSTHYNRKRTTGTTDPGPKARRPLEERFWSKVQRRGPDECWEWQAKSLNQGYGTIARGGRAGSHVLAHRLSWELHFGEIPNGEGHHGTVVMHTCDNRLCVNPSHLRLGTQADNVRDMDAKKRARRFGTVRGSAHHNSKLTEADVRFIRSSSLSQRELAKMFGISRFPIACIREGRTWKHVD